MYGLLKRSLILLIFNSSIFANDIKPLYIWTNKENDNRIVKYLNGDLVREKDRLLKLVDSGFLKSIDQEFDKTIKLYKEIRPGLIHKDNINISSPCFSLSERGEKIVLDKAYYEDGKSIDILDYPSYFYKYIRCQIIIFNKVFSESDFRFISDWNNSSLLLYDMEIYRSIDDSYYISLYSMRINPDIQIFPEIKKRFSARQEKIINNNEKIEINIQYPFDLRKNKLIYLNHLNNNTFLDLSDEIKKIQER